VEDDLKCIIMELPVLTGTIDRRILINYRVKPEVVRALLPPHLEPLVVNGYASAGICLLRLKNIGMKYFPSFLKITSENAAHRFLVTFKEGDGIMNGVYIPRRDTDSMLNVVVAGKMFSWPHHPASFQINEANGRYCVRMKSEDDHASLDVEAQIADGFPSDSMFESLAHASSCFQGCAVGVSPSIKSKTFKKIELKTNTWSVTPLQVRSLKSSYFEDKLLFPDGSIRFDHALLMERIQHEWLSHGNM